MERRQIRELIGRFLHNDVPGELQTQFRRWMLQPGDGDEKEAALREEWTAVVESPAAADRSEELQRLRHTIRMREAQQRRSRIFRRIRYAAAAAAVLLFAVGEYYYVRSASAVPAEIRLLTARGSKGEFQLPDGTKVCMNALSELHYPTFFVGRERKVRLKGEAFFDVSHDRKHPFVVETYACDVEVLGTKFNVKARSEDGEFVASLVEGKVRVTDRFNTNNHVELRPREQVTHLNGRLILGRIPEHEGFLWREGLIAFRDASFGDLLDEFEKYYGVKIEVRRQDIPTNLFTGKIRISEGIDHALWVLQQSADFQYTRNELKDMIYIH